MDHNASQHSNRHSSSDTSINHGGFNRDPTAIAETDQQYNGNAPLPSQSYDPSINTSSAPNMDRDFVIQYAQHVSKWASDLLQVATSGSGSSVQSFVFQQLQNAVANPLSITGRLMENTHQTTNSTIANTATSSRFDTPYHPVGQTNQYGDGHICLHRQYHPAQNDDLTQQSIENYSGSDYTFHTPSASQTPLGHASHAKTSSKPQPQKRRVSTASIAESAANETEHLSSGNQKHGSNSSEKRNPHTATCGDDAWKSTQSLVQDDTTLQIEHKPTSEALTVRTLPGQFEKTSGAEHGESQKMSHALSGSSISKNPTGQSPQTAPFIMNQTPPQPAIPPSAPDQTSLFFHQKIRLNANVNHQDGNKQSRGKHQDMTELAGATTSANIPNENPNEKMVPSDSKITSKERQTIPYQMEFYLKNPSVSSKAQPVDATSPSITAHNDREPPTMFGEPTVSRPPNSLYNEHQKPYFTISSSPNSGPQIIRTSAPNPNHPNFKPYTHIQTDNDGGFLRSIHTSHTGGPPAEMDYMTPGQVPKRIARPDAGYNPMNISHSIPLFHSNHGNIPPGNKLGMGDDFSLLRQMNDIQSQGIYDPRLEQLLSYMNMAYYVDQPGARWQEQQPAVFGPMPWMPLNSTIHHVSQLPPEIQAQIIKEIRASAPGASVQRYGSHHMKVDSGQEKSVRHSSRDDAPSSQVTVETSRQHPDRNAPKAPYQIDPRQSYELQNSTHISRPGLNFKPSIPLAQKPGSEKSDSNSSLRGEQGILPRAGSQNSDDPPETAYVKPTQDISALAKDKRYKLLFQVPPPISSRLYDDNTSECTARPPPGSTFDNPKLQTKQHHALPENRLRDNGYIPTRSMPQSLKRDIKGKPDYPAKRAREEFALVDEPVDHKNGKYAITSAGIVESSDEEEPPARARIQDVPFQTSKTLQSVDYLRNPHSHPSKLPAPHLKPYKSKGGLETCADGVISSQERPDFMLPHEPCSVPQHHLHNYPPKAKCAPAPFSLQQQHGSSTNSTAPAPMDRRCRVPDTNAKMHPGTEKKLKEKMYNPLLPANSESRSNSSSSTKAYDLKINKSQRASSNFGKDMNSSNATEEEIIRNETSIGKPNSNHSGEKPLVREIYLPQHQPHSDQSGGPFDSHKYQKSHSPPTVVLDTKQGYVEASRANSERLLEEYAPDSNREQKSHGDNTSSGKRVSVGHGVNRKVMGTIPLTKSTQHSQLDSIFPTDTTALYSDSHDFSQGQPIQEQQQKNSECDCDSSDTIREAGSTTIAVGENTCSKSKDESNCLALEQTTLTYIPPTHIEHQPALSSEHSGLQPSSLTITLGSPDEQDKDPSIAPKTFQESATLTAFSTDRVSCPVSLPGRQTSPQSNFVHQFQGIHASSASFTKDLLGSRVDCVLDGVSEGSSERTISEVSAYQGEEIDPSNSKPELEIHEPLLNPAWWATQASALILKALQDPEDEICATSVTSSIDFSNRASASRKKAINGFFAFSLYFRHRYLPRGSGVIDNRRLLHFISLGWADASPDDKKKFERFGRIITAMRNSDTPMNTSPSQSTAGAAETTPTSAPQPNHASVSFNLQNSRFQIDTSSPNCFILVPKPSSPPT
eukprot:TRINITY_DN7314_c0_g1_i1.p1 TRINITY_DN7314_c0_g1~~TRINITY_DN7314_c0_g1_i1.p1  ORF type:complete len:1599 (-),score=251.63 TRINITY_DN7314_c0_g1_i1:264-5060(-)